MDTNTPIAISRINIPILLSNMPADSARLAQITHNLYLFLYLAMEK